MSRKALIIEDEQERTDFIAAHLEGAGFDVTYAPDSFSGIALALTEEWSLIIFDLNVPGLGGLEICEKVNSTHPRTFIIIVTKNATPAQRIEGFYAGADDYINKPFSILELMARIHALYRRTDVRRLEPDQDTVIAGGIVIDKSRHSVYLSGQLVELTPREFQLLACLAQSPGKVFTRGELLIDVWGYSHAGYLHTVNTHINRLRKKLKKHQNHGDCIETVWGVGYKFVTR